MNLMWKDWETRGVIKSRRGFWTEEERNRHERSTWKKEALLAVTGVWDACRNEGMKARALREKIRLHKMRTGKLMREQHGQGMYFIHQEVRQHEQGTQHVAGEEIGRGGDSGGDQGMG